MDGERSRSLFATGLTLLEIAAAPFIAAASIVATAPSQDWNSPIVLGFIGAGCLCLLIALSFLGPISVVGRSITRAGHAAAEFLPRVKVAPPMRSLVGRPTWA